MVNTFMQVSQAIRNVLLLIVCMALTTLAYIGVWLAEGETQ